MILFFLFCWFGHVSLPAHIGLYFDSLEPAEEDLVLYGKWTNKEANVISYLLMTSEWHCHVVNRKAVAKPPISEGGISLADCYNLDSTKFTDWE